MTHRLAQRLLVLLALTPCQISFGQPAQVSATQATIIELYGAVQARHAAGGYKTARVGEVLAPGDGIKTGATSRAQLALGQNQYVRMDQSSQLLITHVAADGLTSFKTLVGGVWVTIQKALGTPTKFEVHTPSVVAAARATIFRCQVADSGDTDVYVYDGEVDVTGADEAVRVTPDRLVRARRGLKLALAAIDADEDEQRDFVRYNRHCEALRGLGDPKVLVALSVVEYTKPQAALTTSEALVEDLRQLGFIAQPVAPDHLRDATYDRQDQLRLRPKLADYYLVGAIRVQLQRPRPGAAVRGTAIVRARLVDAGDYHVVTTAQASTDFTFRMRGPRDLPNGQDREAVLGALQKLGHEVARQMAPQLIREIVVDRPAAVRVDVVGITGQRQVRGLKRLLGGLPQAGRITPLPRFDGGVSLLLTGDTEPQEVARFCLERGGPWVQSAEVRGKVVVVGFRPAALPPETDAN